MPCACDGTFKQDSMAYQYICAGVQFLQKPECSQVLFIWAEWKLPMGGANIIVEQLFEVNVKLSLTNKC